MTGFLEILQQERVVVVIRAAQPTSLNAILQALYEGGLRIFEITVEAPNSIRMLEDARASLPQDAILGAGTVLDAGTASLAIAFGAQFVVSPVLHKEVCQVTRAHGLPCILGGMTPTEIHTAYQYGSDVVKVFPAVTVGSAFIHELRGPLNFIPLYVTGGITLENAPAFLDAGAAAVGVGGALVNYSAVQHRDWETLRQTASSWAKLKK
ncbi:MAG TPA: bifunctional 4-hydroxy-2-oxoglutarate aldolase/2-dehydro-3-deoxy-phosphogluconate aldolase [Ktedonobacteraceae bacterium]|nr:bifunctional 4-hydroxy-2-oxoglutarate aldolase/2-dehydro-3-deoxy-phosphogluconate aldolase [Ktedonobacteraceae bacterium]